MSSNVSLGMATGRRRTLLKSKPKPTPTPTPTPRKRIPAYRNLSDELLERIFRLYYVVDKASDRPPRRVSDLKLSKRLYSIIRPLWLSDLKITTSHDRVDVAFAKFYGNEDLRKAVHELHLAVFPEFGHTHEALLASFTHVVDLRIEHKGFDPELHKARFDSTKRIIFSEYFIKALTSLARLRNLTVNHPIAASDRLPPTSTSLDTVRLPYEALNRGMSTYLAMAQPKEISLTVNDTLGANDRAEKLPYGSIRKLELALDPRTPSEAAGLWRAIWGLAEHFSPPPSIPCRLQRLKLFLNRDFKMMSIHLEPIFRLAYGANVETLELIHPAPYTIDTEFLRSPKKLGTRRLILQGPYDLAKPNAVADMLVLLQCFARLEKVELGEIHIGAKDRFDPSACDDLALASVSPVLFALVHALTRTAITSLEVQSGSFEGSMRWMRQNATSQFERLVVARAAE